MQEFVQPESAVSVFPALESHTEAEATSWLLFPEKTNEELLAELRQSMRGNLFAFISLILLGIFAMGNIVNFLAPEHLFMGVFLGILPLVGGMAAGMRWSNWRLRRVKQIIEALQERQEVRTLGLLVNIIQMVPLSLGNPARQATMEAIPRFCRLVTPEQFSEFTSVQINYFANMTASGSKEVGRAVLEMLERCGDARALRVLLDPGYQHLGLHDADTNRRRKACLATIGARVDAEKRLAQLLRPASAESYQAQAELLRSVTAAPNSTPPAELLRAANTDIQTD